MEHLPEARGRPAGHGAGRRSSQDQPGRTAPALERDQGRHEPGRAQALHVEAAQPVRQCLAVLLCHAARHHRALADQRKKSFALCQASRTRCRIRGQLVALVRRQDLAANRQDRRPARWLELSHEPSLPPRQQLVPRP
ncbi:hypothetical protein VARIO8X_60577 [Burkholderiales bacterium 8X]|nr:hypothetical protein VARIO8X_60577 [Burkholderiales bacterium 8X]